MICQDQVISSGIIFDCLQMLAHANELLYGSHYQEALQECNRVLDTSPNKEITLAALYSKAQALDGMGQYSAAAQTYQQIIDTDPTFKSPDILYEQGQLYQLARMYGECKKAYQLFLKRNPAHAECNFNLGMVLESLGQQQEAIKCYERATELRPNYSKAHLNKIAILKKLKRNNDILKTCQVALQSEPTDFEMLYQEGLSLIALQRYKEAAESLRECIRNNKKYSRAYIALADCHYKLERDKEGLEVLNSCLTLNADVLKSVEKKEIRTLMGIIYMNIKEYKPAIDCFREVLSQRPINESVKVKLAICLEEYGNIFFSKRQFSDALTCYGESLNYDTRISAINNQGLAYQNINNLSGAQKCFNQVLKKDPKNTAARSNLAALFHQMGKTQQSKEILQKLAAENPNHTEVHVNNGRSFFALRKYAQAFAQFSQAISANTDPNNYHLFNDMAVTLEKLGKLEEALEYANRANILTKDRSPLFLLNRASILMGLGRINDAREDFDRAAEELRAPDKVTLNQLGISVQNLKYMFSQLNHYAYLMTPINDFKKQVLSRISSATLREEPKYTPIVQKVEKAEEYAMSRIITQIKKETPQEVANPQESRQDYNTILKFVEEAKQMNEKMKSLQKQVHLLKLSSAQMKEHLKYLPQSASLRLRLQALQKEGDLVIWQYGKQLYWILNGYLKSYMLIRTGVVAKGERIDRSALNTALKSVGGIAEYAKCIPVIGEFSELVSRVCGLFVDLEDDAIIEKVYQVISYNYDIEEDLNDEVCESVLTVLNSNQKIAKLREKLTFKPSNDLLQSFKENMQDVTAWFSEKKNEFIMHMRGYQKAENIMQSQLAVIDVGAIISILLNTSSNPTSKGRPLLNAAKKICLGQEVERMVMQAYKRDNQNLRVSNNSFCTIMHCLILYRNPLLNDPGFLRIAKSKKIHQKIILDLPEEYYEIVEHLLVEDNHQEILKLLQNQ